MVEGYVRKTYLGDEPPAYDDDEEENFDLDDRLKEENYYKYHENLSHYDPRG